MRPDVHLTRRHWPNMPSSTHYPQIGQICDAHAYSHLIPMLPKPDLVAHGHGEARVVHAGRAWLTVTAEKGAAARCT